MARNSRTMQATPDQVWDVLADGWLYPLWVVGASRMRTVDEHWPEVGAKLHHSVGTWPLLLDDDTEVVEAESGHSLRLHARAWPTGIAGVTIRLFPTGTGTEVVMEEEPIAGPALLVPRLARDRMLKWRNAEALGRLAFVVEQPPRQRPGH